VGARLAATALLLDLAEAAFCGVPLFLWWRSLAVPLPNRALWPLLPAVVVAARAYGYSPSSLGFRRARPVAQLAIAASGAPLGLAAYAILRPAPPVPTLDRSHLLFGSLTLLVFAAFVEELLFRGLLQQAATRVFGAAGIVVVNLVYAVTAIGSLSAGYAIFVGLTGLWFSIVAGRSRCLWGVIAAHALAVVGLVLVWPSVLD
jgi:membrane protease YdiL (CAAX protease family)